jgi:multicomponent Na+:H+ antiporter subunit E
MRTPLATLALRGAAFYALWFVLMPSGKPADLVVGGVAAIAATWASLVLLPAASGQIRPGAMLAYLPRFLWKSVLAGFDIARRALDPRLPLNPGFVTCPTKLPPGRARNEFASITSLMPGSVPADDGPGMIVFHCLDIAQPVAEQAAAEERALARVLVTGVRHA